MAQFNNAHQSHAHSLHMLELIAQNYDFLDTITTVADMGCGSGMDIDWWARLEYLEVTEDRQGALVETWRPRNLQCYAIDRDIKQITPELLLPSVQVIEGDFEKRRVLSRSVDFMWCHDTFQYCTNPLATLKMFNEQMVENGMLCLHFPTTTTYRYNKLVVRGDNYCYYNHNFLSLVYMLAVNGFDCRDAYFLKKKEDPWISAAVYKSSHAPMDPATTSWHDLAELNLINDSMKNSLSNYGQIRQEDVYYAWLDRDIHQIQD